MLPGFVTGYIDTEGYKHLYFFPGIDDNGDIIYRDLDLSNINFDYDKIDNIDKSSDYKFYNKNIIKITCNLVKNNKSKDIKILKFST